jgi:hypothetical protein
VWGKVPQAHLLVKVPLEAKDYEKRHEEEQSAKGMTNEPIGNPVEEVTVADENCAQLTSELVGAKVQSTLVSWLARKTQIDLQHQTT